MPVFAPLLGKEVVGPIVALAPMSGVSDLGMRRAAEAFGASFVVSEMIDAEFYMRGDAASRVKADGQGILRHVVQIAGCRPESLAAAAYLAEQKGADVIDINMGCPAKKVIGGLAGSALMRDLDLATCLIRTVRSAVSVPITVKMRLGWDASAINAPELARRAEQEGVAMVTVHGRTRCQFYNGTADWSAIKAVKEAVSIPVLANGDCASADDARRMLAASGADGVMVGRAAIGRPWLPAEIGALLRGVPMPITKEAQRDAAIQHYATLLGLFGREQGIRHARKHLAGYATYAGFSPSSLRHRVLVTSTDADRVTRMLADLFDGKAYDDAELAA